MPSGQATRLSCARAFHSNASLSIRAHRERVHSNAAISSLTAIVEREQERIVRLWSKRVAALSHEHDVPGPELREPLAELIAALARLLRERGEDAVQLWPEWVRAHGPRRYRQRFDVEDLVHELSALQTVLLRVYAKRNGSIDADAAELIADLIDGAIASATSAYARVLRTEEVRFRDAAVMESVLHHVDVGILVAEADGTLSYATPPLARLVGVPVRSLIGARASQLLPPILAELQARHPDGRPFRASEMPLLRALKDKLPVRGVEMLLRRPNGSELFAEASAVPLWADDAHGEMVGVIQTMTDRSESRRKSEELSSANDEVRRLQSQLLERTRTQALGQLASGAAHALNNFLNVVRLRITLLRREFKPEHLDSLDRTVRNIGELVSRLQEFATHRQQEEVADADFNALIGQALELAATELERDPAIAVERRLEATGNVRVDPGFFRELVVNLLLAARERLSGGGRVSVRSSKGGGWLSVRIEDSGPPYSSEELIGIFDPLKQKSRTPQLTLLLAVARSQVQRWGGELECSNVDSCGAAFTLRLPEVEPKETHEPERPVRTAEPRRARKVLVVDDDADNARMLAEVLSDEGYQISVAHSGEDALQLWSTQKFDAALLDALMPDMSGWELAREIRERAPQARLGMVTGMDVRGQNRANLALLDAVFRKPIDVNALDEFLSRSEERPETTPTPAASQPSEPAH